MADRTYNLYLSSSDKVSGSTNNNAIYNIIWDSFLPRIYDQYEMTFNFQSTGGYYKDTPTVFSGTINTIDNLSKVYSQLKIVLDLQARSYSYDSTTNGPSLVLGYAIREPTSSTTNGFSAFFGYNSPKMIGRPTQSNLNVKIYNVFNNSLLLTDTYSDGTLKTDMQPWTMVISFKPVENSKKLNGIMET